MDGFPDKFIIQTMSLESPSWYNIPNNQWSSYPYFTKIKFSEFEMNSESKSLPRVNDQFLHID